ncbi:hypothetical protein [Paenibacillus koleovorans]|uniref:hypothetical protein n=1 Tax=Paenibacillus koleovorans TaxID=121608 RepID=UPI000FDC7F29|nr:hypothetical protein [Paenibacillus koleovorans]
MKKIGFIDYYLDEWHALKYPGWIEEATNGAMKVAYAYGLSDSPTGKTNAAWCGEKGIELLTTIEDVVERSDYLIVLSPDHPEYHERLAQLPLKSGKPTYIDKTFAPDRATALRLFELADKHATPMFSSSALRFASEYREANREGIETILSVGPGRFDNYAIHQVEPIVSLMGTDVKRVMFTGTSHSPALLIGFADGRQATVNHFGWECPFGLTVNYQAGQAAVLKPESNFFQLFIRDLASFFETKKIKVDSAETIAIMTILEYGHRAGLTPHQWVQLP